MKPDPLEVAREKFHLRMEEKKAIMSHNSKMTRDEMEHNHKIRKDRLPSLGGGMFGGLGIDNS